MKRLVFMISAGLAISCAGARAAAPGQIGPDFACPRPAPQDGLAQSICDHPAMSREEMLFEQAYYAMRQMVGRTGWKALKLQAIQMNTDLRTACAIPSVGAADQTMPAAGETCYVAQTEKDRAVWINQLPPHGREEVSRPLEQHIALQQTLSRLGYLPSSTSPDGVYGEGTRTAIETWQRVAHRPAIDGFLSNADASTLLGVDPGGARAGQDPSSPVGPVSPPASDASVTAPVGTPKTDTMTVDDLIASGSDILGHDVAVSGAALCAGDLNKCRVVELGSGHSVFFSVDQVDISTRRRLLMCGTLPLGCQALVEGADTRFTITNGMGQTEDQPGIDAASITFQ